MTGMSNLQLAKALADFADALAEYNHLPPIASASVPLNGKVFARLKAVTSNEELLRQVAVWAATFSTTVRFDLTTAGVAGVSTLVEIGARPVDVSASLSRGGLREFELAHGLDRVPADEVTEVPAARLLDVLSARVVA